MSSKSEESMNQEKHFVERKDICNIRQKGFTSKSNKLNSHLLSHSGEKPYQCIACNKLFRYKSFLNRHIVIHSRIKPYECSICLKWFSQKEVLKRHLITHSREKRFACSTCNKLFGRKHHLNDHMLLHSGVKQYECQTCHKLFAQKKTLNEHLRIHSGDKPFECPICSQKLSRKSNLNKHMLIHSKKKQNTSESKQNLQQNSLLIDKSSFEGKYLAIVPNISTEYENNPSTSMAYFEDNFEVKVKQEAEEDFEPTSINLCDDLFIKEEEEISCIF